MKETLLYWVTQENSIEFPLQTSLSYILQTVDTLQLTYPNVYMLPIRPTCCCYAMTSLFQNIL